MHDYSTERKLDEEAAWKWFAEQAKMVAREHHRLLKKHTGERTQREEIPVEASRHDKRMAKAYSSLLAKEAAADILVKAFRDRELGGRLLTAAEAEEYRKNDYRRAMLTDYHGEPVTDPARIEAVDKRLERWAAPSLVVGRKEPPWSVEASNTLGDVAGYLAWRYPWEQEDAAHFVLTGETPTVLPLRLMYDPNKDAYMLEIQSWTSKAALGAAYRAIHGKKVNQPLESNTLTLLEFVDGHTDQEGNRPTWEALRKLWNWRGLGRHYGHYRTFSKAYRRARPRL